MMAAFLPHERPPPKGSNAFEQAFGCTTLTPAAQKVKRI